MKNSFVFICFVFFLLFPVVPGFAQERQIILSSTEYPPYYGQNLEKKGFITQIIVEAFKRKGFRVNVEFFPWKRALRQAKKGKSDGLYTIWYRKDREEWFYFSDPLPPNELVFYTQKSLHVSFKTFQDLKGYRIGVVRGYRYIPEFQDAVYLHKIESADDIKNMERLCKGYNQLILIDKLQARYMIQTRFDQCTDDLEWIGPPIETTNQYLVISKKAADAKTKLDAFNSGLNQMKYDMEDYRIL